MTDNTEDTEVGFVDTPDPYQARNGRREALGIALHLIDKEVDDAETLIGYAAQVDAYLEDGSIPGEEKKFNVSVTGGNEGEIAGRVRDILDRTLGSQSIHG